MQEKPAHILVLRFSAMGDVAMTVPVIKELLQHYPSLQVTMVSNKSFEAFFCGIERLHFFGADLNGNHKGIKGLFRLYKQLKQLYPVSAVADLHNVLRSNIITSFFRLAGTPVTTIDKGRKEKKSLVKKEHKVFRQLSSIHQRYADVFGKMGFPFRLKNKVDEVLLTPASERVSSFLSAKKGKKITVAPFAKHAEKMYPPDKMKKVIASLSMKGYNIVLLGAGNEEKTLLEQWESEVPNVFSAAGKFSLAEEMQIISHTDLMISMDSANMHMASMLSVPVLSIWGATHPYAGFMGYGLDEKDAVQINVSCRPCSVFGNVPCWRGDHACMQWINEQMIINKALQMLG
jgi:ADP-heptose:LPS heptosyltransferase